VGFFAGKVVGRGQECNVESMWTRATHILDQDERADKSEKAKSQMKWGMGGGREREERDVEGPRGRLMRGAFGGRKGGGISSALTLYV
jgi:hypothetical protein